MQWFFIALGAPFLWAMVNIFDKYLVAKFSEKEKERSSGGLVLFSSLIGILMSSLIWLFVPDVFNIPNTDKVLLLICGILTIVWTVLYLFALEIEDASSVVPWFLSVPILGYILGYFILNEKLVSSQLIGAGIIFIGLIILSINFNKAGRKFKHKPVIYMLLACIAIAMSGIIFKYVTVENNFWVSSFWEYLGLGISGGLIFIFIPHYRQAFIRMNKTGGHTIMTVNIVSEFMSIAGNLMTNYALLLAPVSLVYMVGSFQPAIVLCVTITTTKFFPHITKEDLTRQVLLPKTLAILVMLLGSVILFW